MPRLVPLLAAAVLLAGCGGGRTVSPAPQTVEGTYTLATSTQGPTGAAPASAGGASGGGSGGATATSGKALFASNGCGSCHTYKPAGTNGKIGPDLDKLAQYAKQAKQPLAGFTKTSIVDPKAYIQPGFQPVMPSFASLPAAQVKALVDFLTKKGGAATSAAPAPAKKKQKPAASASGAGGGGLAVFKASGCGSCHTYKAAGSTGMIGPDLDKLAQYAQQAKQPLAAFTETSIVKPKAYIQPGFQPVMPSFANLPKAKLQALIAFLTKK